MTTRHAAGSGHAAQVQDSPGVTTVAHGPMVDGRRDAGARRHERVLATITQASSAGGLTSVAAVARAAQVHRSYLYRHPDLLDLIHQAAREPSGRPASAGDDVTTVSLRADLAHARDRASRAEAAVRELRAQLSRARGYQVWAETGLGADAAIEQAQRDLETTRQELADARADLAERREELDAARAANRELMAAINTGAERSAVSRGHGRS